MTVIQIWNYETTILHRFLHTWYVNDVYLYQENFNLDEKHSVNFLFED